MAKVRRKYHCYICGRDTYTDGTETTPPYCCHEPMEMVEEIIIEE